MDSSNPNLGYLQTTLLLVRSKKLVFGLVQCWCSSVGLEQLSDTQQVASSNLATNTNLQMGLNGLDSNAFGKRQAVGIHQKQQKQINAENVDSPAYEYAMAA